MKPMVLRAATAARARDVRARSRRQKVAVPNEQGVGHGHAREARSRHGAAGLRASRERVVGSGRVLHALRVVLRAADRPWLTV